MIAKLQDEQLNQFIEVSLGRRVLEIQKLAGDASLRSYYRVKTDPTISHVIMDTGQILNPLTDSFFSIQRVLNKISIPVPEIIAWDGATGLVLLQDLGDETLQIRMQRDAQSIHSFYQRAIELILRMQRESVSSIDPECPAFHRRFDSVKLMEEFDFFIKHFWCAYLGCSIESETIKNLTPSFLRISEFLAAQPQVFVHRDYHSRNLMICNDDLVVIDFQDARMGLPEYDLASLLKDAYVMLDDSIVTSCLDQFHRESIRRGQRVEEFKRCFFLTCVQRNIKALGTFGFQATTRHNPLYIPYMHVLYQHLRKLAKEPEIIDFRQMFDVLSEQITELR